MNFTIHDVEQGTEEWKKLRKGYFTASSCGRWVADGKGNKSTEKYRRNAVAEFIARSSPSDEATEAEWLAEKGWDSLERVTYEMNRGTTAEPFARAAFEKRTGHLVKEVGFISTSQLLGCSPDGLVISSALDDDGYLGGLEIKCPLAKNHIRWLMLGELPEEHEMQIQHSLAVTGLPLWHFFSWHPDYPPLHVIVERSELTERVRRGLEALEYETLETMAWLKGGAKR